MINIFRFLFVLSFILGCSNVENPEIDLLVNSREKCDHVLNSLNDMTGNGSYLSLKIGNGTIKKRIIIPNSLLYRIYGYPKKMEVDIYISQLYKLMKMNQTLFVSKEEFVKLEPFFYNDSLGSDCNAFLNSKLIKEGIKDGSSIPLIDNFKGKIFCLIKNGYQIWSDDYSGEVYIQKCI